MYSSKCLERTILESNQMIELMSRSYCFALRNPDPEIFPSEDLERGSKIMDTGSSDFELC